MSLRLHNTLTRQEETFEPIDRNHVRFYVCGPTVYDYIHIGNARPIVVFDVLFRLLQRLYPRVSYVRNVTDVEDKIMERAQENGESIEILTQRTTAQFRDDIRHLNALPPTHEPRATAYIAQMQAIIVSLIAKGHAYEADGHVLFNVTSMADYGRLSGHSRDELVAGARVEVAPYKKDAADFVLWKPSTDEQPGWGSPWGRGRPGWHIECSAMSASLLGETFDIHGGGLDLIFPHHENEIAQSRCAYDTRLMAKYWMHNGYLLAHGEKMSKSLGNFFTVHELLQEFPGEAIRYLLLSAHYRQPLDFTKDGLKRARTTLDRLYQALRLAGAGERDHSDNAGVIEALGNDLNTPLALSVLHDAANRLNTASSAREKAKARADLLGGAAILGLLEQDPEAWFKWQPPQADAGMDDAAIDAVIAARLAARKAKNFAEADRIRDDLAAKGIQLEDGPKGTTWRRG
ncbi:MAG: cysS [Alphaproteobacteria bacterium]|nr:cysS [Alphaproteobacteria bacterium]